MRGLTLAAWLALSGLAPGCGAPPPPKQALLIGVGTYAAPDLAPLPGALNDVAALRAVLVRRFGFAPEQITTLTDAAATRAGILAALAQLAEGAVPGAQVLVHFSGHGSQVADLDGDEADGWDESLVPVDSGAAGPRQDLLDDELGPALAAIQARGAALTVILDACHAGTGLRDGAAGGDGPVVRTAAPVGEAAQPAAGGRLLDEAPPAAVLVTAARAGQRAREVRLADGRSFGALTWALVRALEAAPPDASWRGVVARARADVEGLFPNQQPQLEGPGADGPPFAGPRPRPQGAVEVSAAGPDRLRLAAGSLHGLRPGAVVALTDPSGRPVGQSLLDQVGLTTAEGPAPGPVAPGSLARLVAYATPPARLALQVTDPALHAALAAWPQLAPTPAPAALRVEAVAGGLQLQSDGVARGEVTDAEGILQQALAWARWYALATLDSHDALPVALRLEPPGPVAAGAEAQVVVDNPSDRRWFLNLIALGADGSVAVLYPAPGAVEQIEAGRSWRARLRFSAPPEGTRDLVLALFTPQPADFGPITQAPVRDGALPRPFGGHPVAQWIGASALGLRGGAAPLPVDDWAVRALPVEVRGAP